MRIIKTAGLLLGVIAALVAAYLSISYAHLSPSVRAKERLLASALRKAGYQPRYWLISGYRPPWLNRLMPLSAKKSSHQQGLAIDIWVGDINRDGKWTDADVQIVARLLDKLDQTNPASQGGLGLYHKSAPRMVHFDVSGKHRHWDY
ncbi:DUF882 domain-containing protein [Spirosoma sp. 209]|uniref:DUF882 domain-containing protein n=1 Tax=Spirosoma sp. 209 TaxID=1955701 RepID=UPI00098D0D10|nr:DUF882 domain-containing protein [Spirosoma sp. 209]